MTIIDAQRRRLDADGYLVLEEFVPRDLLDRLRSRVDELFDAEGAQAGAEFKQEAGCRRLANLVDKGDIFQQLLNDPRLKTLVAHVLGTKFKLSSLNARSVDPHSGVTQPLHADMAAVADERGSWVCNTVWMLDDFTRSNGAIRIVPGSHRLRLLPQDVLEDPTAPHPDEILLTGHAGTVVVMNAHAWHGGLPNRTDHPRTALHVFFARRDKPQQQYQRGLLRPEVQQSLSPELRHLLALDDPENDRLSRHVAVRSGFLK